MKKIKKLFERGSTIVELLIYVGILTILLTTITSIFVTALDVQLESTATSSVQQDGNYILARLSYDIHRAEGITIPALGVSDDEFRIIIDGESHAYSVDADGNLILTDGSGPDFLNGYDSSISGFTVQHLGNGSGKIEDTLSIGFTVTSRTQRTSGPESRTYQTNLSLRRQ